MKIEVVGDLVNVTGMKYQDFTSIKANAYNKLCEDAKEYEDRIKILVADHEIAAEKENLAYVNNLIDVLDQLGRQVSASLRKPDIKKQEPTVQEIIKEISGNRNPFNMVANALRDAVVDMIDTSVGEEVTTRLEDIEISEIKGLEAVIEREVEKAVEAEVENQLSDYTPRVSADDVEGLSGFVEGVVEGIEVNTDSVTGLSEFVADSAKEFIVEYAKGDEFRAIIREELKKLFSGL